ncbi:unnamed protein product [Lepidochelys kempii]
MESHDTSPICGKKETLGHIYVEYVRLQPFFQLLENLLLRFWLHFSPHLFIFAHLIHGPRMLRDLPINLLLALAKMATTKPGGESLVGQEKHSATLGPIFGPLSNHTTGMIPVGGIH